MLDSFAEQTYRAFEIIVVDQNVDGRLDPILARFERTIPVRRLRSAPGLSRARNVGLGYCSGRIVAFPDDDCWYPRDLLDRVAQLFRSDERLGFLIARWQDENGNDCLSNYPPTGEHAEAHHIWTKGISFTVFVTRRLVEQVGPFDERLGVGSGTPWQSGEETDYLLRALSLNFSGWHDPSCIVYHPQAIPKLDARAFRKALTYGQGFGFVSRKHRCGLGHALRALIRPLGSAAIAATGFNWRRAKFHLLVFIGRCRGLMQRPSRSPQTAA